jgi:hypothetical protein
MKMAPRRLKINNLQSDLMQTPFSCKVERQRRMKSYQKLAFFAQIPSYQWPRFTGLGPSSSAVIGARSAGEYIVSMAGDVYDQQIRGPNRRFRLNARHGELTIMRKKRQFGRLLAVFLFGASAWATAQAI